MKYYLITLLGCIILIYIIGTIIIFINPNIFKNTYTLSIWLIFCIILGYNVERITKLIFKNKIK